MFPSLDSPSEACPSLRYVRVRVSLWEHDPLHGYIANCRLYSSVANGARGMIPSYVSYQIHLDIQPAGGSGY
jgi:hypothetical protein